MNIQLKENSTNSEYMFTNGHLGNSHVVQNHTCSLNSRNFEQRIKQLLLNMFLIEVDDILGDWIHLQI